MSTFVFDCPNCAAKNSTFDVNGFTPIPVEPYFDAWSLFSTCRSCGISCCITASLNIDTFNGVNNRYLELSTKQNTIIDFLGTNGDLNKRFEDFFYSPILPNTILPPEYLPEEIQTIFIEATKCFSIGCYNASGAMFRLCLDITTKHLVEIHLHLNPSSNDNRSIHSRLTWIFNNNVLPRGLEDLSRCIKDDGNDAAHDGSLGKVEAEDLLDFTYELLENVYTQPERIKIAKSRREQRRA